MTTDKLSLQCRDCLKPINYENILKTLSFWVLCWVH